MHSVHSTVPAVWAGNEFDVINRQYEYKPEKVTSSWQQAKYYRFNNLDLYYKISNKS